MNEQENKITKQDETTANQGKGMAMDNKMMILMMLGCIALPLLSLVIPAGWLAVGGSIGGFSIIGIALALVIVFACCVPMMKMMMGGGKQQNDKM